MNEKSCSTCSEWVPYKDQTMIAMTEKCRELEEVGSFMPEDRFSEVMEWGTCSAEGQSGAFMFAVAVSVEADSAGRWGRLRTRSNFSCSEFQQNFPYVEAADKGFQTTHAVSHGLQVSE